MHLSCFGFFPRKTGVKRRLFALSPGKCEGPRGFYQSLARLLKQASRMLFKQAASFHCGNTQAGTCKSLYSFPLEFPDLVVTTKTSTQSCVASLGNVLANCSIEWYSVCWILLDTDFMLNFINWMFQSWFATKGWEALRKLYFKLHKKVQFWMTGLRVRRDQKLVRFPMSAKGISHLFHFVMNFWKPVWNFKLMIFEYKQRFILIRSPPLSFRFLFKHSEVPVFLLFFFFFFLL